LATISGLVLEGGGAGSTCFLMETGLTAPLLELEMAFVGTGSFEGAGAGVGGFEGEGSFDRAGGAIGTLVLTGFLLAIFGLGPA
jgi:hypothetical protein